MPSKSAVAKSLKAGPVEGNATPPPKQQANLTTLGGVRAEMVRVYNQHRNGKIGDGILTKSIWALRQIAQTIEAAEKLGLASQGDDEESRPVFTGLQVVPPTAANQIEAPPTKRSKTNGN